MNYTILKTIIETSLSQYTCQNCQGKPLENSININKVEDGAIDFSMHCPHCHAETHMHAEIGTKEGNTQLDQSSEKRLGTNNIHAIKESDIIDFEKNITQKNSIEDLLT